MVFSNLLKSNFLFKIIFIFLFGGLNSLYAQEVFKQQIVWKEPITLIYEGRTTVAPSIIDQTLDNGKPIYFWTKQLKSANHEMNVSNVVSEVAPNIDLNYLKEFSFNVTDSIQIEYKITESGKDFYAVAYLFPYILKNGVVNRISSFEIILENVKKPNPLEKSFVTNSVLQSGSGTWYKISVKNDGIYKIDKAFLTNLGLDVANTDPRNIRIYGQSITCTWHIQGKT